MKSGMILLIVWVLAVFLQSTDATCTSENGPCQKGSGNCTSAVRLALSGNLLDGINALTYGKYCGASNKCQVVKKPKSSKVGGAQISDSTCVRKDKRSLRQKQEPDFLHNGKPPQSKSKKPCPAIPCDGIDTSCSGHDACLDKEVLIKPPPQGERLPVPQRCHCDVDLVASLAVQATTTAPTGLCDAAFYNGTIAPTLPVAPISLLKHEAVLIGAPFCCVVRTPECATDAATGGKTNPVNYAVASAFCQALVSQFASQGITLCPA